MPLKQIIDPEQNTIDSFFVTEDAGVEVFDRSTAELGRGCPVAGKLIDSGKIPSGSDIASVGSLVHAAIGAAITEFLFHWPDVSPRAFREDLEAFLEHTQPGYQPDVIEAVKRSTYEITRFISEMPVGSILGYDGGQPTGRGSQYTIIVDPKTHFTSEIDFLWKAPDQDETANEIDYKSGYKVWDKTLVKNSFQFQSHALLIFDNMEKVQELKVQIWNTRINRRTYAATFYRTDRDQYFARVKMAIARVRAFRKQEFAVAEPTPERCRICPAAALCPLPLEHFVTKGPAEFVTRMRAVEACLDAMKEIAAAYVDETGQDIVADGICFGRAKPVSGRKSKAVFYEQK